MRTLFGRFLLVAFSLSICTGADADDVKYVERAQAEFLGSVFGLGAGVAAGFAVTLNPSRIDQIKTASTGQLVEQRTYIKDGLAFYG